MRVPRSLAVLAGTAAAALALSSCAGQQADAAGSSPDDCGPLDQLTKVTLGVNPGAQDLIVQAIKDQELDKKYNLDLDVRNFENPPASAQAVTQKSVDIGFGGVTTMAQARSKGRDVFLFGSIASPSNGVFVPKGSDIKDIGDLVGKRVGTFGANNSATSVLLSAVAAEKYDVDDLQGQVASMVTAPDAALTGLLNKGELDAILLGSTATVKTQLEGKLVQVGDLSTEYIEATGIAPVHVALASTDSYAKGHCSELIAFSNAIRDGVEYALSDDGAWEAYAEDLGLKEDNAADALRDLLGENFRIDWTQKDIDGIQNMLESFIPILGADEFVAEIPDGLFRSEFTATE